MHELADFVPHGGFYTAPSLPQLTSMTPLQYQKQLRLQAARERMLMEDVDATTAAYEVGYESVSQFNREYSRMFGNHTIRDIKAHRSAGANAIHAGLNWIRPSFVGQCPEMGSFELYCWPNHSSTLVCSPKWAISPRKRTLRQNSAARADHRPSFILKVVNNHACAPNAAPGMLRFGPSHFLACPHGRLPSRNS